MARLDPSRTALEIGKLELDVIGLLQNDPHDPALCEGKARAALAGLEREGIVEDGRVVGYAARIVDVVVAPELRVMVNRFAAQEPLRSFGGIRRPFGIWGEEKADGCFELTPLEPGLIPWEVARTVGLGPRATPRLDHELRVRASVLQGTLDRLAAGGADSESVDELLATQTALGTEERSSFVQLLVDRRLTWRAFSTRHDGDDLELTAAVAVLDAGDSGLWFSEHEQTEDPDDPFVCLTPAKPSEVWDRIVDLVPAELREPETAEAGG